MKYNEGDIIYIYRKQKYHKAIVEHEYTNVIHNSIYVVSTIIDQSLQVHTDIKLTLSQRQYNLKFI